MICAGRRRVSAVAVALSVLFALTIASPPAQAVANPEPGPAYALPTPPGKVVGQDTVGGEGRPVNCNTPPPGVCTPPLLPNSAGKRVIVQANPRIFLIFWGHEWERGVNIGHRIIKHGVETFVTSLRNSPYNAILGQYGVRNTTVQAGVAIDGTAPNLGGTVATMLTSLEAEVVKEIKAHRWQNDANAQFIVLTEQGTAVPGTGFCAFHNTNQAAVGAFPKKSLVYSLMPWQGDRPAGCFDTPQGSPTILDTTTRWLSHEYVEAATDPKVNFTWTTTDRPRLTENGDLCEAYPGVLNAAKTGIAVYVQRHWRNDVLPVQGCALR